MTTLDKADIQEQTAHIGRTRVGTVPPELIRDHLANPTPENTAAVEAECFSPRSPSQGETA